MRPEIEARGNIDRQLEAAGWLVSDISNANIPVSHLGMIKEAS